MSGAGELILMAAAMHILGLACAAALIFVALRGRPDPPQPPSGESDGGGGLRPRLPRSPTRPKDGLPLPDAQPSRIRLREPGRLADRIPAHQRRPAREPERTPVRDPT